MKILLINPHPCLDDPILPRPRPPLDLLYIAASLRGSGHIVSFLDQLAEPETDIPFAGHDVLITTTSPLDRWQLPYRSIRHVSDLVRKAHQAGLKEVIVTGPHGTVRPREVFRRIPELRLLVRGEPEETVPAFLANRLDPAPIEGMAWKDHQERIIINPDRMPLDVSSLPFPALDLAPMDRYRYNIRPDLFPLPFAVMESSRGCPFNCVFCLKAMYGGRTYRPMDVGQVIRNLRRIRQETGVKSFYFQDLLFNLDRDRTLEICREMITNHLDLQWACACALINMDQETAGLMARAGCRSISFGLESLSPRIWSATGKRNTLADLKRAVLACRDAGIHFHPFYSEGHPGESRATVIESLRNAWRLRLPHPMRRPTVIPLPGTILYEEGRHSGIIPEGLGWEEAYDFEGCVGTEKTFRHRTVRACIYAALLKLHGKMKGWG